MDQQQEFEDLFALTRALVDINSVTGEEAQCGHYVHDYLAARNFQVEKQPVTASRFNVFATWGKPEIVLSTHLDTVPPFQSAWEDGEFIYGRGSCDAKGILASQITAAERLRNEGVGDFGLLYLVGEEVTSDGAAAANRVPRGTRFMINGEPTGNKLALGSKGILRVDVRARGKMAHSAYPHLGESAIEKMLDVLNGVRRITLPEDPVLGQSTLNIGLISGGRAGNVIPDEAYAQVIIRTVSDENGRRRMKEEIQALARDRAECEFVRETPPIRMQKLDGFQTDVVAFTTDLPSLAAWGEPFLLGPGSIHVAHTDHERIRKADLVEAVDLYCRLARELKKRAAGSAKRAAGHAADSAQASRSVQENDG
ncbi:MAG: M20/M25/M40 family metallo-hydrolase [Terriglobia bacterium]